MSTPHRASSAKSSAKRTRVHACTRALLLLAGGVVFVRVLASEPVYAKAPPPSATSETPAKTTPQRPKASASTTTPAPTPRSTPPAADTSTKADTKSAAKPDSKPDNKSSAKSSTKASAKTKPGATRGKSSKTRIEEEFLIEGKLEKPSAYYILRRSEVDFDWARLGATFSPLVLESVQDPLF